MKLRVMIACMARITTSISHRIDRGERITIHQLETIQNTIDTLKTVAAKALKRGIR